MASVNRRALHNAIPVPVGLVLLLNRLDVDVKFFDFLSNGPNGCSRHVFGQLGKSNIKLAQRQLRKKVFKL